MSVKIGVAFIGCAHPHIFPRAELLAAAPDVQIVGCYDPDAALARGVAERCAIRAYDSAEALLDEPSVRLAIIEGWDTDNPAYVQLAAQRGKAILVEKPGAPNLAAMQQIAADVRAANVPFQVGYMLRFSPAVEHMRRILSDGVLGPVTLARFHAAAPVGGAAEIWQSVPGDMGGVVFTDGCHMVNIIVHLLGLPRSATGMLLRLDRGPNVIAHGFKQHTLSELDVTVELPLGNLMYEDGGAAVLGYSDKLAVLDVTGWEAHPWVEAWRVELYGTNGTLHAGLNPPWYRLFVRNATERYQAGWHSWEGPGAYGVGNSLVVDDSYSREIAHVLDRVRRWDTDNRVWLHEAEGVVAVLDAIFEAAASGKASHVRAAQ